MVVADRPYIRPLLPLAHRDGRYFLLVTSKNEVRLLAGLERRLTAVTVPGLPHSLAEVMATSEWQGQLLVHAGRSGVAGKEGRVYYGESTPDHEENELREFCLAIDRAVAPYLRAHAPDSPLIFCGVERLQAEVAESDRVAPRGITRPLTTPHE